MKVDARRFVDAICLLGSTLSMDSFGLFEQFITAHGYPVEKLDEVREKVRKELLKKYLDTDVVSDELFEKYTLKTGKVIEVFDENGKWFYRQEGCWVKIGTYDSHYEALLDAIYYVLPLYLVIDCYAQFILPDIEVEIEDIAYFDALATKCYDFYTSACKLHRMCTSDTQDYSLSQFDMSLSDAFLVEGLGLNYKEAEEVNQRARDTLVRQAKVSYDAKNNAVVDENGNQVCVFEYRTDEKFWTPEYVDNAVPYVEFIGALTREAYNYCIENKKVIEYDL